MMKIAARAVALLALILPLAARGEEPGPGVRATVSVLPGSSPTPARIDRTPETAADTEAPGTISGLYEAGAGGPKLFIECQGTGNPAVVMDAGLGVGSYTWSYVQSQVALLTRVCRYDRAGLGTSGPGPLPRTSSVMVEELRGLLASAGVTPPYVLVGASFGGLNVQLYSIRYPQEVLGLVLVDSLHPEFDERIEMLFTPEQVAERRAELGDNPEGVRFADILESQRQVREAGTLPDLPQVVIRHGRPWEFSSGWPEEEAEKLWVELQTDLASQSSTGKLLVADGAGHRITDRRADLVIEAIREVVGEVRR